MATFTSEDEPTFIPDEPTSNAHAADDAVLARLTALEHEIARGNRDARRTGTGFAIFAVAAVALAMVTLVAVLSKDNSGSAVSVRNAAGGAPMMGAGTAAVTQPAPARRVAVSLAEYTVHLSSTVGRAGAVSFAVHNARTMPHEFVVVRTSKPAADLLKGNRADEAGNVGETGDLQPGASKTINLQLKAGHYALICNLPGHYMAGQHADFTVR